MTTDPTFDARVRRAIDLKTKPVGSLGRIERLAARIAHVQRLERPTMTSARLTIFAADHGMAAAGVSAFPQEVTAQMVANFLAGGAAANQFALAVGADIEVVDAGVATPTPAHPALLDRRIAAGTKNAIDEPAMDDEQCRRALEAGRALGRRDDVDAVLLGEMGIGNTSAAALIAHKILDAPLAAVIGPGTGHDQDGMARKHSLLARAAARTAPLREPKETLRHYGGFEIAMMAGAALGASESRRVVVVDGFIASAAALIAAKIDPAARDAMVFAHRSAEPGHRVLLEALDADPLLDLDMRLGEGTGALLAWPLLKAAARMLSDMASFEDAGVSGRSDGA